MRLSELHYAMAGVIGQVRMINSHGSTQRHTVTVDSCPFMEKSASPLPPCPSVCLPESIPEPAMDVIPIMDTHP